jgi:hypothetical protein
LPNIFLAAISGLVSVILARSSAAAALVLIAADRILIAVPVTVG